MLKKLGKILGVILLILVVISLALFTSVDKTPLHESDYYKKMMVQLDSTQHFPNISKADTIKIGWAKANLVPPTLQPLAGYGKRKGAIMDGVLDTTFVRAIVFDNGKQKAVYLAADLLIVPPEVSKYVKKNLPKIGFDWQEIFMTATHSHSSVGAWAPGVVGNLFAGEYDETVVRFLGEQFIKAIQLANKNKITSKIGFKKIDIPEFVRNRLVAEKGIIEPGFRILKIKRDDSSTAVISSYSAHATCLGNVNHHISRDYPGRLVQLLETSRKVDFALFGAGTVGSMGYQSEGETQQEELEYIATGLFQKIAPLIDAIPLKYETELGSKHVKLPLRKPHARVTNSIRVRPWVFFNVYGKYPTDMSFLKIGNTAFVSTPCDFSGELMPELDAFYQQKGLNLFVNSFNGAYIGYVTKDEWYMLDEYETKTMNWFGPHNGAYLSEVIERFGEMME